MNRFDHLEIEDKFKNEELKEAFIKNHELLIVTTGYKLYAIAPISHFDTSLFIELEYEFKYYVFNFSIMTIDSELEHILRDISSTIFSIEDNEKLLNSSIHLIKYLIRNLNKAEVIENSYLEKKYGKST